MTSIESVEHIVEAHAAAFLLADAGARHALVVHPKAGSELAQALDDAVVARRNASTRLTWDGGDASVDAIVNLELASTPALESTLAKAATRSVRCYVFKCLTIPRKWPVYRRALARTTRVLTRDKADLPEAFTDESLAGVLDGEGWKIAQREFVRSSPAGRTYLMKAERIPS